MHVRAVQSTKKPRINVQIKRIYSILEYFGKCRIQQTKKNKLAEEYEREMHTHQPKKIERKQKNSVISNDILQWKLPRSEMN